MFSLGIVTVLCPPHRARRRRADAIRHAAASALIAAAIVAGLVTARPAAASWVADTTIGTPIVVAPSDQLDPLVVSDNQGGCIVLWTDYRKSGSDPDLYCQRVNADGDSLWGAGGTVVCDAVGLQIRPTLIADGQGGAFMAWMDLRTAGGQGYYVQHFGPNGVRRWAVNGLHPVNGFNSSFGPKICRDTTGGIFFAFTSASPGLQIQRLDSLGVKKFSVFPPAEGVVLRSSPAMPHGIVADGSGGAIVAIGYGGSTPVDIAAQRVSVTGTLLWAPTSVTVCAATGMQGPADIVSDGAGGGIFVWDDARVAGTDTYAQRVNGAGTTLWAADGTPVCAATGSQSGVQLRREPDGSVVAVFRDTRNSPANSLYAQRLGSDGTLMWPAAGQQVWSGAKFIERFTATAGVGDTTFVEWNSSSGSGGDVYAQKLDGDGIRQWNEVGATVCHGPSDQTVSTAVGDGAGNLIVVYGDNRSGDREIYASRLGPAGVPKATVGVPLFDRAPGTALPGVPNPARGVQVLAFARALPSGSRVDVLDVSGRLRVSRALAAGATSWSWDGRDHRGARVEPGVYLVRVASGRDVALARLVRIR